MVAKRMAEVMNHLTCFFPIARVKRRLATAGLLVGIDHRHAVTLKQPGSRTADLRIELVDVAGDEQGDRLAGLILGILHRGRGRMTRMAHQRAAGVEGRGEASLPHDDGSPGKACRSPGNAFSLYSHSPDG